MENSEQNLMVEAPTEETKQAEVALPTQMGELDLARFEARQAKMQAIVATVEALRLRLQQAEQQMQVVQQELEKYQQYLLRQYRLGPTDRVRGDGLIERVNGKPS